MRKLFKKIYSFFKEEEKSAGPDEFMAGVNIRYQKKILRSRHYLLIACFMLIVVVVVWAYFSKIDEVTRGVGRVIPSGKVQVVQHLEGGIVEKILVQEGDEVRKGQVLMLINDINYKAIYQEGLLKAAALKAKVARLEAQANAKPFYVSKKFLKKYPGYIEDERKAYEADKQNEASKMQTLLKQLSQRKKEFSGLKARITKLKASLDYVDKERKITEDLYREGAASKVEMYRAQRQAEDIRGEISETKLDIERAEQAVQEALSKLNEQKDEFKSNAAKELAEARAELSQQEETNISLKDRASRTVLRSPVDGIVKVIYVNTVGGIVKPGEKLMEIVPEGEQLLVEARINPKDIAFIHPGQKATVKFTAYDFIIYGGLKGVVEHISADTVTDEEGKSYYIIRIRTNKSYLGTKKKPLRIIPGMTAEVDILTGRKSILTYILKPLLRGTRQALSER